MPGFKVPTMDVSMSKGKSGKYDSDIKQPSIKGEGSITVPKITTPDLDLDGSAGEPKYGGEAHVEMPDEHAEREHRGLKLKMPTLDIGGLKGGVELDLGLHRGEGKKDKKRIELPDLELSTPAASSKVKGPKMKGSKFKIGMPKMKNIDPVVDVPVKKPGKENEGISGAFKIKKTKLKGDIPEAEVSGSVLPNISLPAATFTGPKVSLGHIEGPDINAKTKHTDVEISAPSKSGQGGAWVDNEYQDGKGNI